MGALKRIIFLLSILVTVSCTENSSPQLVEGDVEKSSNEQSALTAKANISSDIPAPCGDGGLVLRDIVGVTGNHDLRASPRPSAPKIKNEKVSRALGKDHFHQIDTHRMCLGVHVSCRRSRQIEPQNREKTEMSQQYHRQTYGGSPPDNYERYFVPTIGAPVANDLIKIAALGPGERVLDVACGTGVVARLASQQVGAAGTVAGLDINPGMLAVARSTTPPDMAIDWHEGSAEQMPLPDASFDAVLCQMGLQFVSDKLAALREMRRVLASDGRLILNVPGPAPKLFLIMEEAFARHIGAEAAEFVNQVFSLHDRAELQSLISGAGFRDASVEADTKSLRLPAPDEFLWQYVHSTPLAEVVGQVNDEIRASVEHDIVAKWQAFVKDRAFILQVRMVVATARK